MKYINSPLKSHKIFISNHIYCRVSFCSLSCFSSLSSWKPPCSSSTNPQLHTNSHSYLSTSVLTISEEWFKMRSERGNLGTIFGEKERPICSPKVVERHQFLKLSLITEESQPDRIYLSKSALHLPAFDYHKFIQQVFYHI